MTWVGHKTPILEGDLRDLLKACQNPRSCYFLRWPSHVSGFVQNLPEDGLSPEGQLFDMKHELRWRRQGNSYSVLLLTTCSAEEILNVQNVTFRAIAGNWDTKARHAHVYAPTETRVPTEILDNGVNISHRYFMDIDTSVVHFIALTTQS